MVGSKLLGQTFTGNQYFQGRPSAAGITASGSTRQQRPARRPRGPEPVELAAARTYGPNNSTFLERWCRQRVAAYRKLNGLVAERQVPVDAVTSSGSGVDPEISVANARLQAARVAQARGISQSTVEPAHRPAHRRALARLPG